MRLALKPSYRWATGSLLLKVILVGVLALTMRPVMELARQNVLAARVIHGVMPLTLTMSGSDYLQGMLNALGLMKIENGRAFDLQYYIAIESSAPETADAHRLLGQYALLSIPVQLDLAETQFRLAAEMSPGNSMNWLWLGRAEWATGDFDPAVSDWENATGDSPELRRLLADALYTSKQPDLARRVAIRTLYLPNVSTAFVAGVFELFRWQIWWESFSEEDAIRICSQILAPLPDGRVAHTRWPGAANIYARRALAFARKGEIDQAHLDLDRASGIAVTPYVEVVQSAILISEGNPREAYSLIQSVLTDTMSDAHAWLLAGDLLNGMGYRTEAREAWQNAARWAPNYNDAVENALRSNP